MSEATTNEHILADLTPVQKEAVKWRDGALLVLAGPGSGKTQVVTRRIAYLLDFGREETFRILALTFTNKAADEMRNRVEALLPGFENRIFIGTFHGFCTQVLRQHGVHVGIKSDFTIYSADDDRERLLTDAINDAQSKGADFAEDDVAYLRSIDRLKSRLIPVEGCAQRFRDRGVGEKVERVYELYEAALKSANALDFNSLVMCAVQLFRGFPVFAERYRKTYRYWMIDEFQDTTASHYALIRSMDNIQFRNVFAVADDDQIIFQWNGADYKRLVQFRTDYEPELIQLPTNYRCPPEIVSAANNLVRHNLQRTRDKVPLVAWKQTGSDDSEPIRIQVFESDQQEAQGIAKLIAEDRAKSLDNTAVIARTRSLLEGVKQELEKREIRAVIAQRRDRFVSPEFIWLHACLRQAIRRVDRRNFVTLVMTFNAIVDSELSPEDIISEAEGAKGDYLLQWIAYVTAIGKEKEVHEAAKQVQLLASDLTGFRRFIKFALEWFESRPSGRDGDTVGDLAEDRAAWSDLTREIRQAVGANYSLEEFLQELDLRSKEPPARPNTVSLMTIHGAKGKEFDFVYLVGMAEDMLPSFQSKKQGDSSPEMEEERRNCFVAITRTKTALVLSRGEFYRGWKKAPSRFLREMGLGD